MSFILALLTALRPVHAERSCDMTSLQDRVHRQAAFREPLDTARLIAFSRPSLIAIALLSYVGRLVGRAAKRDISTHLDTHTNTHDYYKAIAICGFKLCW